MLIEAGCEGSAEHEQPLDHSIENAGPWIVWRRSMPHAGTWPDLDTVADRLEAHGYQTRVIVIVRDHFPVVRSQVQAVHAATTEEAERRIPEACGRIFDFIGRRKLAARVFTYEGIVHCPDGFRLAMVEWGIAVDPKPVDGNEKYLTGASLEPVADGHGAE